MSLTAQSTGRGVPRRPGSRPVMTDVARVAGVSQKTVSRVVNGSANVREDVRLKVLSAIEELGFRPNAAARALASQRSGAGGHPHPGDDALRPVDPADGPRAGGVARRPLGRHRLVQEGTLAGFGAAVRRLLDSGVDGLLIGSTIFDVDLTPRSSTACPPSSSATRPPRVCPSRRHHRSARRCGRRHRAPAGARVTGPSTTSAVPRPGTPPGPPGRLAVLARVRRR
jgi:hypothetical protein